MVSFTAFIARNLCIHAFIETEAGFVTVFMAPNASMQMETASGYTLPQSALFRSSTSICAKNSRIRGSGFRFQISGFSIDI